MEGKKVQTDYPKCYGPEDDSESICLIPSLILSSKDYASDNMTKSLSMGY